MDPITQQTVTAAAGAGGGDPLYVDDVFSTYLTHGDETTLEADNKVINGIDLDGKGGMVWSKCRSDTAQDHAIHDTERGVNKFLNTNSSAPETDASGLSSSFHTLASFNVDGFTVGQDGYYKVTNFEDEYVHWTFRKAPGFFDVVTYTGNGTAGRTVAHNLGSVPGMIIVKKTSGTGNWVVYHRSTGNSNALFLHTTGAASTSSSFNNTTPTSTEFTVNNGGTVNASGETYVAYIFAHDAAQFGTDKNESIIKCGSFSVGGTGDVSVNLGWEPHFILFKDANNTGNWYIQDITNGTLNTGNVSGFINPNQNVAEVSGYSNDFLLHPTSTGFIAKNALGWGSPAREHIYMAIRRPHKPPEAATEVFAIDTGNSSSTIPCFDSGFPVDFAFRLVGYASGGNNPRALSRLQGAKQLYTSLTSSESNSIETVWDSMSGFEKTFNSNDIAWMFKRAPGFMDVVAYTGTGSARTVNHNLSAIPELMLVKDRGGTYDWRVYVAPLSNTSGLVLNDSTAENTGSTGLWNSTTPTSTNFTVGNFAGVNGSGSTFIAYLFATLPGISKVGSYTGTGSAMNIDCGFTNGARFVLIKRSDDNDPWMLYDTTRGIVSGNDPYLNINSNSAPVTNTDYIDPLNAGFIANPNPAVNTSGGSYIFLAIA